MNSDLGCQVLLTLWIRLFYRLHVEVLNSEPRLSHVLFDSPNSALLLFALLLVFFCFHFRCFHFDFQTLLWNYSEQEKIKGVWSSMSRLKKLSKPSVGKGTQTKEMENPTACGQLGVWRPFHFRPWDQKAWKVNGALYSVLVMQQIDGVTCKLRHRWCIFPRMCSLWSVISRGLN